MNAHVKPKVDDSMMSPLKVAAYVSTLEQRLGRRIDRAVILPDGGIEVRIAGAGAGADQPSNPADLVDMSE